MQGGKPCKERRVAGRGPCEKYKNRVQGGSPAKNAGMQGREPARSSGCGEYRQKEDVCPLTKVGRHCKIEVGIISEFL